MTDIIIHLKSGNKIRIVRTKTITKPEKFFERKTLVVHTDGGMFIINVNEIEMVEVIK